MGVVVVVIPADHQRVDVTLNIEPTGGHHAQEDEENSPPDGGLS